MAQRGKRFACLLLLGCVTLGGVPQASAHAFLNASIPSPDSTVSTPPKEVTLSYSEPVEIRFSIFKAYKLSSGPGADIRALHSAADALVSVALLKRGDEASRSDAGVANTTRTSTDIVLRLKDLEPGAYVLMWRVLSVDTHTTQGSFVFVYTPAGAALDLTPARDSFMPAPPANVPALADRREPEAPSTSAGWMAIPLPSDSLALPIVEGGDPARAHAPLRLRLPEFDAVDVPRLELAGQPVLSLEPVSGPQDPSVDVRAVTLAIDAPPQTALQALQGAPSERPDPPANIHASGVLMYRFMNASVPPVAGGGNLNALAPTPGLPTINDGVLEAAVSWTLSPTFSLFADQGLESTTGVDGLSPSDIEQAYLDAHNLFGLPGSGIRLGRDRIKLGFTGLLLDETDFDGGRRDGVEARVGQLGPVSVLGFMQFALDNGLQLGNWPSTRRVWGARAEADVVPGWTVNVSYRADTAGTAEVGTCPGIGCNVGNGFSAGVQGDLMPGMNLIVEAATYRQLGDVGRWYYEPSLALDLQQLLNVQTLQPVLTLWYKNFDPYTLPLDAPLGHLLTPDDFRLFNTNDNLTAVGARLDLSMTPALSVFALAEWGAYKGGGPNYDVYSIGARYALPANTQLKVAYNVYSVAGGIVTTSPQSGLQLSNAQVVQVELTRTF